MATLMLMAGCGFQLRGQAEYKFAIKELNVTARDTYGSTLESLKKSLSARGVSMNVNAPYTLDLIHEKESVRNLTYSRNLRGSEKSLERVIIFQLRDKNNLVLLQNEVSAQRVYLEDQNNLMGSSGEQGMAQQSVQRDLINALMSRLQSITQSRLDTLKKEAEDKAKAKALEEKEAAEAMKKQEDMSVNPIQIPPEFLQYQKDSESKSP